MQMTGDLIGEELGHGRCRYCRASAGQYAATRNVPSKLAVNNRVASTASDEAREKFLHVNRP
ncbi:hypothetical protein KCP76_04130 [Salmonella enterica subsp. enterica serovar Weltevreden]|nr:hypothetical protein KCP76_04130 [Salmonella enterica subsp. enterica serovar Weltevreden]